MALGQKPSHHALKVSFISINVDNILNLEISKNGINLQEIANKHHFWPQWISFGYDKKNCQFLNNYKYF